MAKRVDRNEKEMKALKGTRMEQWLRNCGQGRDPILRPLNLQQQSRKIESRISV
jgi:hypothetical protein